jgi:hypothetical protein
VRGKARPHDLVFVLDELGTADGDGRGLHKLMVLGDTLFELEPFALPEALVLSIDGDTLVE